MMNNYPVDEVLNDMEEEFEITLMNKESGVTYPDVPVGSENTMGQLLSTYAADIGINAKKTKILFINKRTGDGTSDLAATVRDLGLKEGDVLAVAEDGIVA